LGECLLSLFKKTSIQPIQNENSSEQNATQEHTRKGVCDWVRRGRASQNASQSEKNGERCQKQVRRHKSKDGRYYGYNGRHTPTYKPYIRVSHLLISDNEAE